MLRFSDIILYVQLHAYEAARSQKKETKIKNSVKISNKFSYYNPNTILQVSTLQLFVPIRI
jgi:hypothetical protein